MIHNVLNKYGLLLYGTIGLWKIKPVDIELHPDTKI